MSQTADVDASIHSASEVQTKCPGPHPKLNERKLRHVLSRIDRFLRWNTDESQARKAKK